MSHVKLTRPQARYPVKMEVAGPLACFSRPDTGATPTSYPVPTWSAVKGMFEGLAMFADGKAYICPTRIEICRRVGEPGGVVRAAAYTTNYGGPLRKRSLFSKGTMSGGSSFQMRATVLTDVCYRLYGTVVGHRAAGHVNARHHLKDLFERRLQRGQVYRTIHLGQSEFACSYVGPFRHGATEVDDALDIEIPSMLLAVWDRPVQGRYAPTFQQNVVVSAGTLEYAVPESWLGEPDQPGVAHVE